MVQMVHAMYYRNFKKEKSLSAAMVREWFSNSELMNPGFHYMETETQSIPCKNSHLRMTVRNSKELLLP